MLVLFRKTGKLMCSFCGANARDAEGLIAGAKGQICATCAGACVSAMSIQTDKPLANENNAPSPDPKEDCASLLGHLNMAQIKADAIRDAMEKHVCELRNRKVSWAKIGESLGISRQAAWQRFS